MDIFQERRLAIKDMRALNRCRIYLQVLTISDITETDGKTIMRAVKTGQLLDDRTSTLLWPKQGRPSPQEWNIWKLNLAHLEEKGKLVQPLGLWIASTHQRWRYVSDLTTGIVYDTFSTPALQFNPVSAARSLRSGHWYVLSCHHPCMELPKLVLPTSIINNHLTDGSLFQFVASPNSIPPAISGKPTPNPRTYYENLLSTALTITHDDLIAGESLHICVSCWSNRETGTATITWCFQLATTDYSGGHTEVTTQYRAALKGLLIVLYTLYQAESRSDFSTLPTVTIQCNHKKALKEAFRTTPLGVTMANQVNYDIILDIRHIRTLLQAEIQSC